jgi:hypothetical protein
MEALVFVITLLALALVAGLATRFGTDSRIEGPSWAGGPFSDRRDWRELPHG